MNNWENFNETELPSKDKFYSSLGLEDISDSDYRQANKVFKVIKLNNIGDYHDLYVQVDTVQLTDIFENFRNTCHEIYELDPVNYVSAPSLSWNAFLKSCGYKHLELLTDMDMILMIKNGVKGGICHVTKKYAKSTY